MKLILGLGNPGSQYSGTRHNLGFMAIDSYAAMQGALFAAKPKFYADIAELVVNNEKILLVKPTTYYNEVGRSIRTLIDFYKIDSAQDLLVIHDDLSLPFGTIRLREKGRDAGNNGIKSINNHIGENYARIRLGIYSELRERTSDADFVLAKFSRSEDEQLAELTKKIMTIADEFIDGHFVVTSHS